MGRGEIVKQFIQKIMDIDKRIETGAKLPGNSDSGIVATMCCRSESLSVLIYLIYEANRIRYKQRYDKFGGERLVGALNSFVYVSVYA